MTWRMSRTKMSYHTMRARCLNPRHPAFQSYRSVTICEQWLESYDSFLADMGERPDGMTLDRIDNDGNYKPENCRWATRKEQQRNTRSNRIVEWNGEKKPVVSWAEKIGVRPHILRNRIRLGWSIERAMTAPLHQVVGQISVGTIRAIDEAYSTGLYTQRQVARMFGTSSCAVSRIVNRKNRTAFAVLGGEVVQCPNIA